MKSVIEIKNDQINNGKQNSENPKTKTYEYGDALISRDVVCDEFVRGNTKESRREEKGLEKVDSCKKKNVSMSSELPVAKSKWGVKLRHVITRDSSIDDNLNKVDVEPQLYNFKRLSKHARPNSVYEESSRKSEEVTQLWRSKSNDLIFNSSSRKEECNKHEFPSVLQRLKSFETNSRKIVLDVGREIETTTKPLSLEDLLNLDEQNLSVDVIDKCDTAFNNKEKTSMSESRCNQVDQGPKVDYIPLKNINGNNYAKYIEDNVAKEVTPSNRLPHENMNCHSLSENDKHSSTSEINENYSKKQSTFAKTRTSNPKKPISLQELLMLDEQNLSIDVIDKSDNVKVKTSIFDLDLDKNRDVKSNNFISVDFPEKAISKILTNHARDDVDKVSDSSRIKEVVSETMLQPIYSIDSALTIDSSKQRRNLKANVTNIADRFTRIDNQPHEKYNKLGQIILSTDSSFEEGLVKSKRKFTTQKSIHDVDNGSVNHSSSGSHTKVNDKKLVNHNGIDKRIVDDENKNTLKNITPSTLIPHKVDCIKTDDIIDSKRIDHSKTQLDIFPYNYDNHEEIMSLKKINGINDLDNFVVLPKEEVINHVKSEKCVNNRILLTESRQTNGILVDNNLKDVDSYCQPIINVKQIANSESDLLNPNQISRNGPIKKLVETTKISLPTFEDEKTIPTTPERGEIEENISRLPINRKVGKLIIMTGDQRNEQLNNEGKISTLNKESHTIHINGGLVDDKIEELKKHKEGFSLTFMSNELEDNGIPDDYLIPQIVFNGPVVGLKSMIHKQKNAKVIKHVLFNNAKLTTIHTYPAEETYIKDEDCSKGTKVDNKCLETNSQNDYPSMKTYEPSYSFDFGSVIQRERQRFHSLDEENLKAKPKQDPAFDYMTDGDHFNSHHNQDAGHALLF